MKKRLICVLAALFLLVTCFAGCGDETGSSGQQKPGKSRAQLVVALNPVLVYEDNTSVVAYNDIKDAIKADNEKASLAAMYQDTAWKWAYNTPDGWEQRPTYNLGLWKNGAGVAVKKTAAYSFNAEGDISLSRYTGSSLKLSAYDNAAAIPQMGLLLSAAGSEQEALCYTVEKDGKLALPMGSIVAIAEVAGVKTGFLAEDGTPRSAALTITLNSQQLWSGTLCNTTAAADGVAVTALNYPQLDGLQVKAGDKLFFTLRLDAQANREEDVSKPGYNEEDFWTVSKRTELVKVTTTFNQADSVGDDGSIPMFLNYTFNFRVVRESRYSRMVAEMNEDIIEATGGYFLIATEEDEPGEFEIVVGRHAKYPESIRIYDELKAYRADSAMDYAIQLIGTRVYIVAVSDTGLQRALDHFMDTFGKDDKAVIPGGYSYVHRAPHEVYLINGQNVASYSAIRVEKYPNYMTLQAARDLQNMIQEKAGYEMPIVKGIEGINTAAMELRVGPINDIVMVDRTYNTHFTIANDTTHSKIETDGLLDAPDSYYEIKAEGKHLVINGGSNYAINAGMQVMLAALEANRHFTANQKVAGDYLSQFAYWDKESIDRDGYDARYDTVKYDLSNKYGLVFSEEFNVISGDHAKTEADIRLRWQGSTDGTQPTPDESTAEGFKVGQHRPDIYGENWWVQQDATGNGYLLQVTKYASGTMEEKNVIFDAGRLIGESKWGFRYGVEEVRLVPATRAGACSAVWSYLGSPVNGGQNEIDTFENYGIDALLPALHAWVPGINGDGYKSLSEASSVRMYAAPGEHFYDSFHTVGIEWTSDALNIFLDGEIYSYVDISPDKPEYDAFRTGTTLKLANGIGVGGYTGGADPWDYMPYHVHNQGTADELIHHGYMHGKYDATLDALEDFFEVQYVDFVHIYQQNPKGQKARDASQFSTSSSFGKFR